MSAALPANSYEQNLHWYHDDFCTSSRGQFYVSTRAGQVPRPAPLARGAPAGVLCLQVARSHSQHAATLSPRWARRTGRGS